MLTTRFLFPKLFSQKNLAKNLGGSPMEDFGNGTCAGSGPAPPRPPFVQMKNSRGVFFPPAFRPRSGGARQQFRLLGAESRISVCRSFAHICSHIPSSR